jgi:hypothetical protein
MSYLRHGTPLSWFLGESKAYVYMGERIVDYSNDYEDLPTLIELVGTFIERECNDKEFATKIVRLLAEKLGVAGRLRERRLTDRQLIQMLLKKGYF